jgi:CDP-diacylglycerol--serine O-phosphatidyltransferase
MKLKNLHLYIPNALTLTNLLLGCIGILYAFDERYFIISDMGNKSGLFDTHEINSRLFTSSIFIFIAAIIDFADGFIARMLHAQSEIGKHLDSLADVVTFGVLPGIIIYQLLERAYFTESGALYTSKLYLLPALLIPLAAAYRLARFNTGATSKEYFTGLATPAMGIFVATLPLIYFSNANGLGPYIINKYLLYAVACIFSYLMVSDIRMFSLKFKSWSLKENLRIYIFLISCAVLIVWFKYTGIALSLLLYILFSLFVIRFPDAEE